VRVRVGILAIVCLVGVVKAQSVDALYSRKNTLSIFANYSNDSSHILIGRVEDRKLLEAGVSYQHRWLGNKWIEWSYEGEVIPFALESDPVKTSSELILLNGIPITITNGTNPIVFSGPAFSACQSGIFVEQGATTQLGTYSSITTQSCSRRWTYAGGLSPLGQRISFAKRFRWQPYLIANAGFLVSMRDIPQDLTSRFNFTFEGGAGIEWFKDHTRSVALDWRVHHLSNDYIGASNPGVDSSRFRIAYTFGR
jgi:hypothetical protein